MPRSLTTHIDSPGQLGGRLRSARETAGFSQRQLAFDGCTAAYISRLEAGARVPSLQMINELAVRLGVSSQWLATGVDASFAEPTDLLEAEVALRIGDLDEAERLYRARLQPGDPCRAAAVGGLGQLAFRAERFDDAIDLLRESLALNGEKMLADPGAVDMLGRAFARIGDRESAIALFRAALSEAAAADASVEELRFTILLANVLIDNGAYGDAEQLLAGVIPPGGEMRAPLVSARVYWSQSRLHGSRGEASLAARYARRALDILERTEHTSYVALAHQLLAFAENEAGNGEAALELLERGRTLLGSEMTDTTEVWFSVEQARALVLAGDVHEAARAGAVAFELLDVMPPGDRGHAYITLADVFVAVGDTERARALYGAGLDLLVEHGKPRVIEAGRKYADLLEAEGDTAGALRVLRQATNAAATSNQRV